MADSKTVEIRLQRLTERRDYIDQTIAQLQDKREIIEHEMTQIRAGTFR